MNLLLGLQWGDEGKGKIVDVLTSGYKIIARFQGGPNAGHTLVFNGKKHVLHTIPSGIFHENKVNIIGNGVVIDPVILRNELKNLEAEGIDYKKSLLISRKAHLILPTHRIIDATSEKSKGKNKIGSTLKGIGPTYMDKTGRNGFRVGDLESENWIEKYAELKSKHKRLIDFFNVSIEYNFEELEQEFFESIKILKSLNFIDSEQYIYQEQNKGSSILAEGAQGSLLDIDFGTYPFVTSSNTSSGQIFAGTGFGIKDNHQVFGITKAYTTRVGSGPFPSELFDEIGNYLVVKGKEFGTVTKRKRRCGWFDTILVKQTVQINGVSNIILTKLDVLDELNEIKICVGYKIDNYNYDYLPFNENLQQKISPIYKIIPGWKSSTFGITEWSDLPKNAQNYINYIEEVIKIKISIISTGPERSQTIDRNNILSNI